MKNFPILDTSNPAAYLEQLVDYRTLLAMELSRAELDELEALCQSVMAEYDVTTDNGLKLCMAMDGYDGANAAIAQEIEAEHDALRELFDAVLEQGGYSVEYVEETPQPAAAVEALPELEPAKHAPAQDKPRFPTVPRLAEGYDSFQLAELGMALVQYLGQLADLDPRRLRALRKVAPAVISVLESNAALLDDTVGGKCLELVSAIRVTLAAPVSPAEPPKRRQPGQQGGRPGMTRFAYLDDLTRGELTDGRIEVYLGELGRLGTQLGVVLADDSRQSDRRAVACIAEPMLRTIKRNRGGLRHIEALSTVHDLVLSQLGELAPEAYGRVFERKHAQFPRVVDLSKLVGDLGYSDLDAYLQGLESFISDIRALEASRDSGRPNDRRLSLLPKVGTAVIASIDNSEGFITHWATEIDNPELVDKLITTGRLLQEMLVAHGAIARRHGRRQDARPEVDEFGLPYVTVPAMNKTLQGRSLHGYTNAVRRMTATARNHLTEVLANPGAATHLRSLANAIAQYGEYQYANGAWAEGELDESRSMLACSASQAYSLLEAVEAATSTPEEIAVTKRIGALVRRLSQNLANPSVSDRAKFAGLDSAEAEIRSVFCRVAADTPTDSTASQAFTNALTVIMGAREQLEGGLE